MQCPEVRPTRQGRGPERPRKAKPNLQDNEKDLKDQEMQYSDVENQD